MPKPTERKKCYFKETTSTMVLLIILNTSLPEALFKLLIRQNDPFGHYHCFTDSRHSFQQSRLTMVLPSFPARVQVHSTQVQWDLSSLIAPANTSDEGRPIPLSFQCTADKVFFGSLSCMNTNPWTTRRVPDGIMWYCCILW